MKISVKISACLQRIFVGMPLTLGGFASTAHAEMASVYGGRDGYCGSRTANGERVNWREGSRLSQWMRHSSH
jgi:hypothetical protein